jgi:hypothetical protein
MESAAFLIAFFIILVAVWIGWQRLPITWQPPRRAGKGRDPGRSER